MVRSFSDKCTWVPFVMAFFVLYIHADNLKEFGLVNATTSLDYILLHILARGIGGVTVPFFIMWRVCRNTLLLVHIL